MGRRRSGNTASPASAGQRASGSGDSSQSASGSSTNKPADRYAVHLGLAGALVVALISALAAIGGTVAIYKQTDRNQRTTQSDRLADIRRESYSKFLAQTQVTRNDAISINNLVAKEDYKGAVREIGGTYQKGITEWAKSAGEVDLVAGDKVRKAAIQVSLSRDQFTQLTLGILKFKEGQSNFNAPYDADHFNLLVDTLDKKVKEFVAIARTEVI